MNEIMPGIYGFFGDYEFLSNFPESPFIWNGLKWKTLKHAYQAAKSNDEQTQELIRRTATPGKAKKLGKAIRLRDDWEQIKDDVMLELLRIKFQIPEFKEKLLATEDLYLEETNTWKDTYWGVYNGKGKNKLGLLLMKVRKELRDEK